MRDGLGIELGVLEHESEPSDTQPRAVRGRPARGRTPVDELLGAASVADAEILDVEHGPRWRGCGGLVHPVLSVVPGVAVSDPSSPEGDVSCSELADEAPNTLTRTVTSMPETTASACAIVTTSSSAAGRGLDDAYVREQREFVASGQQVAVVPAHQPAVGRRQLRRNRHLKRRDVGHDRILSSCSTSGCTAPGSRSRRKGTDPETTTTGGRPTT